MGPLRCTYPTWGLEEADYRAATVDSMAVELSPYSLESSIPSTSKIHHQLGTRGREGKGGATSGNGQ